MSENQRRVRVNRAGSAPDPVKELAAAEYQRGLQEGKIRAAAEYARGLEEGKACAASGLSGAGVPLMVRHRFVGYCERILVTASVRAAVVRHTLDPAGRMHEEQASYEIDEVVMHNLQLPTGGGRGSQLALLIHMSQKVYERFNYPADSLITMYGIANVLGGDREQRRTIYSCLKDMNGVPEDYAAFLESTPQFTFGGSEEPGPQRIAFGSRIRNVFTPS